MPFPSPSPSISRKFRNMFSVSYSEIAWVSSVMLASMYAGGQSQPEANFQKLDKVISIKKFKKVTLPLAYSMTTMSKQGHSVISYFVLQSITMTRFFPTCRSCQQHARQLLRQQTCGHGWWAHGERCHGTCLFRNYYHSSVSLCQRDWR